MVSKLVLCLLVVFTAFSSFSDAFQVRSFQGLKVARTTNIFMSTESKEENTVKVAEEIIQEPEQPEAPVAPFLSQGEISTEALNPDFTDPKETRVMIYMIVSLIPVLFLIPLMLGSRELIPLDALPPVGM